LIDTINKLYTSPIKPFSTDFPLDLLEGLIDSDGNIERRSKGYFCVSITNKDKAIIDVAGKACDILGFKHSIYSDGTRFRLFIFNKMNLLLFSIKVSEEFRKKGRGGSRYPKPRILGR
jgi:hypothetical protein